MYQSVSRVYHACIMCVSKEYPHFLTLPAIVIQIHDIHRIHPIQHTWYIVWYTMCDTRGYTQIHEWYMYPDTHHSWYTWYVQIHTRYIRFLEALLIRTDTCVIRDAQIHPDTHWYMCDTYMWYMYDTIDICWIHVGYMLDTCIMHVSQAHAHSPRARLERAKVGILLFGHLPQSSVSASSFFCCL